MMDTLFKVLMWFGTAIFIFSSVWGVMRYNIKDLYKKLNEMKTDFRTEMKSMKSKYENEINNVKDEIKKTNEKTENLKDELMKDIRAIEKTLIKVDTNVEQLLKRKQNG